MIAAGLQLRAAVDSLLRPKPLSMPGTYVAIAPRDLRQIIANYAARSHVSHSFSSWELQFINNMGQDADDGPHLLWHRLFDIHLPAVFKFTGHDECLVLETRGVASLFSRTNPTDTFTIPQFELEYAPDWRKNTLSYYNTLTNKNTYITITDSTISIGYDKPQGPSWWTCLPCGLEITQSCDTMLLHGETTVDISHCKPLSLDSVNDYGDYAPWGEEHGYLKKLHYSSCHSLVLHDFGV